MSNVGTQDWQLSVVSAQIELASVAGGTGTATVALPPNAETLVIKGKNVGGIPAATVTGVTTGIIYSTVTETVTNGSTVNFTIYVDVSPSLDASLTISLGPIPSGHWYAYSDNAVHVTTDYVLYHLVSNPAQNPNAGIMAMAEDPNTLAQYLQVDLEGNLNVSGPTLAAVVSTFGTILAAPASGAFYIYGWWFTGFTTAAVEVALESPTATILDSTVIPIQAANAYTQYNCQFVNPIRVTGAIVLGAPVGGPYSNLLRAGVRYRTGL